MIIGYTTLMSPESMSLPYLETLLSWSKICDKIAICYSKFPDLKINVPDNAVAPWTYDGSIEILEKFDNTVLGNKLVLCENEWNPDNPREDGRTKQIAREVALQKSGNDSKNWLCQFDADEILRDQDGARIISAIQNQGEQTSYFTAGILEMFGGIDKVRFGFGSWLKIRVTRATHDLMHDMVFNARARHPETGLIIAKNNMDDGAGFVSRYDLNRPNYNNGGWLFDPNILNTGWQYANGKITEAQIATPLEGSINNGVWIFHTSWVDIARKWRMGWFFDNFWSVLNGKQKTFIEKAELNGSFTHTRMPDTDQLESEIQKEMQRPGILSIKNSYPSVFKTVEEWRKDNLNVNKV